MPLEEVLTDSRPFGPIDQALIDDLRDAVDILGLFGPLNSALFGNFTLVYGRKGCGKSAVISMIQGLDRARGRIEREHIKLNSVYQNAIVLTIKTWQEFFAMSTNVQRQLLDLSRSSSATQLDYDLIPAETVEAAWVEEIWDHIFQQLYDMYQDRESFRDIPRPLSRSDLAAMTSVMLCFNDDAMARMRGTPEYLASKIFQSAKGQVIDTLIRKNVSICVIFDSLERYPMSNPTFGLCVSGFLRAINKLTTQHNKIKILFTLPEELIPLFRANSTNILKDFSNSYGMRWVPSDLLRIVAHRYKLFLKIHDNGFYRESKMDVQSFHRREHLDGFFDLLLPNYITNAVGVTEAARAYVLRHTHLLPRHILLLFNKIARHSYMETSNWRHFTEKGITNGIASVEEDIANEILHPYEAIYPNIRTDLNRTMGELPPIFSFGDLHKCVNRIKESFGLDHNQMIELLYRIGLIGRICKKSEEGDDSVDYKMYTMADFFFNSIGNISFSGDDTLCFHPIFSQFFKAYRHRDGDKRIIYPRGLRF